MWKAVGKEIACVLFLYIEKMSIKVYSWPPPVVQDSSAVFTSSCGGYSSSWEAFQVDVEARTSNTAVLFAGVYLTVGSLRDPFRKSISTNCTMSKASQLL